MEQQKAKAREYVANATSAPSRSYDRKFSDANPADRRAAINLVQFANRESDLGLSGNTLQTLIYSLNVRSSLLSKFDDVSTDTKCFRANHPTRL